MDDGTRFVISPDQFQRAVDSGLVEPPPSEGLRVLEALGVACADVTRKLRSMSESEREFWATRAYQATDRKTRRTGRRDDISNRTDDDAGRMG